MKIHGFNVIVQQPVECRTEVRRSIMERFFSWPFHPFEKAKTVIEYREAVKDGDVMRIGDTLVCNQATFEQLRKEFEK